MSTIQPVVSATEARQIDTPGTERETRSAMGRSAARVRWSKRLPSHTRTETLLTKRASTSVKSAGNSGLK